MLNIEELYDKLPLLTTLLDGLNRYECITNEQLEYLFNCFAMSDIDDLKKAVFRTVSMEQGAVKLTFYQNLTVKENYVLQLARETKCYAMVAIFDYLASCITPGTNKIEFQKSTFREMGFSSKAIDTSIKSLEEYGLIHINQDASANGKIPYVITICPEICYVGGLSVIGTAIENYRKELKPDALQKLKDISTYKGKEFKYSFENIQTRGKEPINRLVPIYLDDADCMSFEKYSKYIKEEHPISPLVKHLCAETETIYEECEENGIGLTDEIKRYFPPKILKCLLDTSTPDELKANFKKFNLLKDDDKYCIKYDDTWSVEENVRQIKGLFENIL